MTVRGGGLRGCIPRQGKRANRAATKQAHGDSCGRTVRRPMKTTNYEIPRLLKENPVAVAPCLQSTLGICTETIPNLPFLCNGGAIAPSSFGLRSRDEGLMFRRCDALLQHLF